MYIRLNGQNRMKLSIIIPVYNEEKTILGVIERAKRVRLSVSKEIIVVDDHSIDNTSSILKKNEDSNVKVLRHKKNYGKGMAVRTALNHATGDIILIQDADLEYSPEEYPKLIGPILNGAYVVYGTRLGYIKKNVKDMYWLHYFGNKLLTLLTKIIYGSNITDMETGYKVFRKEVLSGIKLRARRFDFEPEITAKILKKGYSIVDVPISFNARKFEEGKKITWKDGIIALVCLIKYRFVD